MKLPPLSPAAEAALAKTKARWNGSAATPAPKPKRPTSTVEKSNTPSSDREQRTIVSLNVVVDGPINHFMFLEGRAWVIDMVKSLRSSPAAVVIERLAGATAGRPGSYAAGIESVINQLKDPQP